MNNVERTEPKTILRFWGVRGSLPSPGPGTLRYGGNTACVEVRVGSEIIVFDAGTGIRALGDALVTESGGKPIQLSILVSHTHWDHIQGFPFFTPAWDKGNRIRVIGQDLKPNWLREAFEGQMDSRYFPVGLHQMGADIQFEQFTDCRFHVGDVLVRACDTHHPGACVGYRAETPGGAIVYLPDHEAQGHDEEQMLAFLQGAEVFIADAQYDRNESVQREGWGHSCVEDAVALAVKAKVKKLYLFHHDPSHSDEFMDGFLERARKVALECGGGTQVEAAREGDVITL